MQTVPSVSACVGCVDLGSLYDQQMHVYIICVFMSQRAESHPEMLVAEKQRTHYPESEPTDVKSWWFQDYETLLTPSLLFDSLLGRAPSLPLLVLAWSSASPSSHPHPPHHPPLSEESCSPTSTVATAHAQLLRPLQFRGQQQVPHSTSPSLWKDARTFPPTNRTLHHSPHTPSMSRASPGPPAHRRLPRNQIAGDIHPSV